MQRIFQMDGEETDCWLGHDGSRFVLNTPTGAVACQLDPTGLPGGYKLRAKGVVRELRLAVGPEATFVHMDGRTYEVGRVDPADAWPEATVARATTDWWRPCRVSWCQLRLNPAMRLKKASRFW